MEEITKQNQSKSMSESTTTLSTSATGCNPKAPGLIEAANKEILASYFRRGCKKTITYEVGVEIEHFIVHNQSRKAVSYYGNGGIRDILLLLIEDYNTKPSPWPWSPQEILSPHGADKHPFATGFAEKYHELGFETPDFAITLEPAAQIEISIRPTSDLAELMAIYEEFRARLIRVITPFGYELVNEGYQPASSVADLLIIPKERYHFMNQYFLTAGTRGMNMMRGTASVQVSVDYRNEESCRMKMQAAYLLMPAFKLLMDNCKTFEGKPNKLPLRRTEIWDRVDPARCGIVPGALEEDFGFLSYADYIMNVPPIFLPIEEPALPPSCSQETILRDTYTGMATTRELFSARPIGATPSLTDVPITQQAPTDSSARAMAEHLIGMVFPDVRLKNFIEIRGADSTEPARTYAYCALQKGLMYDGDTLNTILLLKDKYHIGPEEIRATESNLMEHGWEGTIYGISAPTFVRQVLDMAKANLPEGERTLLDPFFEIVTNH